MKNLLILSIILACTACGGGGGDEPQAETPVAETPKYHVPNGPAVGPAKGNEPGVVCDTTYPAPSGCRKL